MRLIDTSILIDFFRGVPPAKNLVLEEIPVISTISVHEIFAGFKYLNKQSESQFFRELFDNVELLDYSKQAAEESSSLAAILRKKGISINPLDLMIAGTAVAHGISEIASKDSHFIDIEKVSDLKIVYY